MIGARLLFITWLTKNTFSKRTPFLLLYSLFTIPKNYLLPAKRKVSYMSGKLSMSVLYCIFSNHLHSYCIHCKRRGMQQCHVFLNCCHVEKMTQLCCVLWYVELQLWCVWYVELQLWCVWYVGLLLRRVWYVGIQLCQASKFAVATVANATAICHLLP